MEEFDIIRIESKRDLSEPTDVPVSTDRYKYILQREEIIPVPREIRNVLGDAIITIPSGQTEDGRVQMRHITRFPFTVLYQDIGRPAFDELRDIAKERSITQADIDSAMAPSEEEDSG